MQSPVSRSSGPVRSSVPARPQGSSGPRPVQIGGTRPLSSQNPRPMGVGGGQKKEKGSFRIYKNDEIKAPKILLLDDQGEKIGVVTRFEALRQAEEKNMDLVQVAYNAEEMTATAKIIDFGKHQYEKKKLENEKKKTNKSKGQKEIKFGYNIGDNDLQMKIETAKKLIAEGYILKMIAKLKGREKAYKDIVRIKFDYIEEELNKVGKSQGIRAEDTGFAVTVMPKK